jgi:hypothetical protein
MRSAGLEPGAGDRFTQPFHGSYQNLLALLAGTGVPPGTDEERKHGYIVVGAHYDHVGYGNRQNSNGPYGYIHNGADDNASGVATLLEVIDVLAHADYHSRRSILFAFWDGEENGLLGSRYWLAHPTVPLSSVCLMVNVDMVGRMRDGRLEIMGTRLGYGMRQLLSSPRLPGDMWLDFTWELKANSDHWPFLERDIPTVCLHTGLHYDYHRPSDDIEKLNVVGMQQVARYLLDRLTMIADADQLPSYRQRGWSDAPFHQRRAQQPLGPPAPRLGISWRYVEGGKRAHCLVTKVLPDSPSARAGLRMGDQIRSIDGHPITGEGLLPAVVLRALSAVRLGLLRPSASTGLPGSVAAAAEDRLVDHFRQEGVPVETPEIVTVVLAGQPARLGLSWREDESEPGSVYVTRVVPYSPAARAGIQLLDRIIALDGAPVVGKDDLLARLRDMLAAWPEALQLTIETRGRVHDVEVPMGLPPGKAGDRSF